MIVLCRYILLLAFCLASCVYADPISDRIFEQYREANNLAYKTGDSRHIKKLYSGDINACWTKNNINYSVSLVNPLIPEDAEHTIKPVVQDDIKSLKEYGVIFHEDPTHQLVISYSYSYDSRCSDKNEVFGNTIYKHVRINGDEYAFPGLCPTKDLLETRAARVGTNVKKVLSEPFIKSVLMSLNDDEKGLVIEAASNLTSKAKLIDELELLYKKYQLGPYARRAIVYELCHK